MDDLYVNRLMVSGSDEDIDRFVEFFTDENGNFVFSPNKVEPMPDNLANNNFYACSKFIEKYRTNKTEYLSQKIMECMSTIDSAEDAVRVYDELLFKHGTISRTDWFDENWGCSSYDEQLDFKIVNGKVFLTYTTFGGTSYKVIKKLSKMFSYCVFKTICLKTDRAYYSRETHYLNGVCEVSRRLNKSETYCFWRHLYDRYESLRYLEVDASYEFWN